MMFMGEYSCKSDSKGRITMPSKFREQLTKAFVITRGLDGCIDLYPMETWDKKMQELEKIKVTNENQRKYSRFVLSAATELEFDGQGRINIPSSLLNHSGIKKEVVVTGSNDRIEIWAKDKWDKFISETSENIEDIVNDIDF